MMMTFFSSKEEMRKILRRQGMFIKGFLAKKGKQKGDSSGQLSSKSEDENTESN